MSSIKSDIEQIPVIDTHEHLRPEELYIEKPRDVFSLFRHYCSLDLVTSGMPQELCDAIFSDDRDVMWKWSQFEPYYENIQLTGYCRAAHSCLKRFYGADHLTKDNIVPLSREVAAATQAGLYRKTLREACNIECFISCDMGIEYPDSSADKTLCRFVTPTLGYARWDGWDMTLTDLTPDGSCPSSIESLVSMADSWNTSHIKAGALGVKFNAFDTAAVDPAVAKAEFDLAKTNNSYKLKHNCALIRYLKLMELDHAVAAGYRVPVHTGYWCDFRELSAGALIPFAESHPAAKIDMYHLGYPYVQEAICMGKRYANVWVNFVWLPVISPHCAEEVMDELLDTVPVNKLFAFGGDYSVPENVYGHLDIVRTILANVLEKRVKRGEITPSGALTVAEKLLYANPKTFYGL